MARRKSLRLSAYRFLFIFVELSEGTPTEKLVKKASVVLECSHGGIRELPHIEPF
jgi:hypothetical protein